MVCGNQLVTVSHHDCCPIVALLNGLLFIVLVVHPGVYQSTKNFSDLMVNSVQTIDSFSGDAR